jgi:hypothetical protein
MIYELRLYSVTQGRMADVLSRFKDHLPPLFTRHGVNCVGAWTTLAGAGGPRFIYLMAYRDYAHREAVWASFYADAEWTRVRTQTNAGHEMVERHDLLFLKPNAAWQMSGAQVEQAVAGLHEVEFVQIAPGQNAAVSDFISETYLPVLSDSGARTLGVFDVASGAAMPQLIMFHAWQDPLAWRDGRLKAEKAPGLRKAFESQRKKFGHPLFGRTDVNLLEPVSGFAIHPTLG